MKHILIIIFSLTVSTISAQEQVLVLPQKRDEIEQKIQENKEKIFTQIEQKRIEIRKDFEQDQNTESSKIQILTQERTTKIIETIFLRFEATLVKFDGILERINVRIQKNKENGLDMTKQQELFDIAKQQIEESNILISAVSLELTLSNQTVGLSKKQILKNIELCKESLKQAKQALVDITASLKSVGDLSSDNLNIIE